MRLCCMQPDIPGIDSFPGKQLHCHNFRHNEPFRGERILVVGASFSGECMGYPGAMLNTAKSFMQSSLAGSLSQKQYISWHSGVATCVLTASMALVLVQADDACHLNMLMTTATQRQFQTALSHQ